MLGVTRGNRLAGINLGFRDHTGFCIGGGEEEEKRRGTIDHR